MVMNSNPEICRPISITFDDAANKGRLGGDPPVGVLPNITHHDEIEYFLTIPWYNGCLSLFLWLSPISNDPNSLAKNSRKVHGTAENFVQVVLHPEMPRSTEGEWASSLDAYGLNIGNEIPDLAPFAPSSPWRSHKLGGRAVFNDAGSPAYDEDAMLVRSGYKHVLQMCFPDNEDALVNGSWPFGDFTFHFYARELPKNTEFMFLWG